MNRREVYHTNANLRVIPSVANGVVAEKNSIKQGKVLQKGIYQEPIDQDGTNCEN
jgi:hypothetical protein